MATIMADLISEAIRETISDGIRDISPEIDPVSRKIVTTSANVTGSGVNGLGRDWKVKHVFCTSDAGGHMWRSALGSSNITDQKFAAYVNSSGTAGARNFLALSEVTAPNFVTRTLQLKQGIGAIPMPLTVLQANQLDATVGDIVKKTIQGAARRCAFAPIHSLWKLNSTNNAVVSIYPDDGTDIGTTEVLFSVTAGRIGLLRRGQMFTVFANGSATSATGSAKVVVNSVDYKKKRVGLVKLHSDDVSISAATTYDLVPYSNEFTLTGNTAETAQLVSPSGWIDWMKDGTESDVNVFGISTTAYPEFKSFKADAGGKALSSTILNSEFGGFMDAFQVKLDTFLTTEGVVLGALENVEDTGALIRYDVQGTALDVVQGFDRFAYAYNGSTIKVRTSPYCPTGVGLGLKLENNIKKYVPPKLPGSKSGQSFDGEIEFVAPVWGGSGIWWPAPGSNSGPSDVVLAHYMQHCEFAPEEVRGIRISNLAEQITAS